MARKKITVVGAGNVGATLVQRLAELEIGDVVVVDIPQTEGMPAGKALDLAESAPIFGYDCKLTGTTSNRSAIGARIRVEIIENGVKRSVYRHVNSGGSFGCNPLRQHIGIGSAARIEALEVSWPTTGATQVFHDLPADLALHITEGSNAVIKRRLIPFSLAPAS